MYYVKLIPGIKKLLRRCTTMNVGIKGFGAYAPEKVVENAYFESFLETSDEWISKMTGIK